MVSNSSDPDCLACQIISGTREIPGGIVYETEHWVASHCVGALGIGSIVLATRSHRPNLWELSPEESAALGPVMQQVSGAIVQALGAERVYVSLWVDQPPHHVHFVLQPRYPSPAELGLKALPLQQYRLLQGKPNAAKATEAAQRVRDFLRKL